VARTKVLVAGTMVMSLLVSGCVTARAGAKCRTRDFGQDASFVLACRNGRWTRIMTKATAAQLILQLLTAQRGRNPQGFGQMPIDVLYVLPSDVPEDPGIPAAIRQDLAVMTAWFDQQTGGLHPNLTRTDGSVNITTVRLPKTRIELEQSPYRSGDALAVAAWPRPGRATLAFAAIGDPQRLILDRFGPGVVNLAAILGLGGSNLNGPTAQVFMYSGIQEGDYQALPSVSTTSFGFGSTLVAAHELVHAMGGVPSCAPHSNTADENSTDAGHVTDSPADIMYRSNDAFSENSTSADQLTLDVNRDDYFGPGSPGCFDLSTSPMMTR